MADEMADEIIPKTALIDAAAGGYIGEVKRLLSSCNGLLNEQDADGWTAATVAARYGYSETLTILLTAGADPEIKTIHGHTALMWAAHNGFVECVQSLLSNGANVNSVSNNGDSSLILAARSKSLRRNTVCELLVGSGADVNIKNSNGKSALDVANEETRGVIAKAAEQNAPKVEVPEIEVPTADKAPTEAKPNETSESEKAETETESTGIKLDTNVESKVEQPGSSCANEVDAWLNANDLGHLRDSFRSQGITTFAISQVVANMLSADKYFSKLGVSKIGDRAKILHYSPLINRD